LTVTFTIRKMEKGDSNDIIDNYYSYYEDRKTDRDFGVGLFRRKPSRKSEKEWFLKLYKLPSKDAVSYVAVCEGRVVGLCDATRMSPRGRENDHVGSLGIAIRKEYRGMRIGDALMSKTLKESKNKFEIVRLTVFSSNLAAKRLYQKFGFKRYGTLPKGEKRGNHYIDVEEMYIETKNIN
jgi:RimJ/RimL family protein N-acetyltransferase